MEYLFVYGQFRDSAKYRLEQTTFCGKSSVGGKIYMVDDFYPGFVRGAGKVIGDIYLIDSDLFPSLDEFEGDEYIRRKIRTVSDIECWIYEYKHDITNHRLIESGDWLLR